MYILMVGRFFFLLLFPIQHGHTRTKRRSKLTLPRPPLDKRDGHKYRVRTEGNRKKIKKGIESQSWELTPNWLLKLNNTTQNNVLYKVHF